MDTGLLGNNKMLESMELTASHVGYYTAIFISKYTIIEKINFSLKHIKLLYLK